jgi:hypothetical protein
MSYRPNDPSPEVLADGHHAGGAGGHRAEGSSVTVKTTIRRGLNFVL